MATPGVHRHRVSFHSCTILFSRGSERWSVVLPAPMQHGKAWSGTKLIFLFTPTAMFSYKAVSQRREKGENILGQSRKYFLYDWVLKPQTFPVFVSHATTRSTQVVILESSLSSLPHIAFLHFPIQLLMLWGSPPPSPFLLPNRLQLQAVT